MKSRLLFPLALAALVAVRGIAHARVGEERRAVVVSGGHETDPRDRGRPVVLIAGALGVKPEVFREAFSRVRPAPDGQPSPEDARRNKDALLGALAKYGVTNERLDEVSNRYRYRRERGEMWPTTPARLLAIVKEGRIARFEIAEGGSGYSSAPHLDVPGFGRVGARVELAYGKEFATNGSLRKITLFPKR